MFILSRLANGRNIILLLLLFLLFNLAIVPAIYPEFQTLDTLTSYTPEQAYRTIGSYSAQDRQTYAVIELTLDIVYPFISALLFSLAILYTFQRAFPGQAWSHKLALLPFGVMLADYLENACIVTMLWSYPRQYPFIAALSNIFTAAKLLLTPFELLFLVGLVGWLIQRIRRQRLVSAAH